MELIFKNPELRILDKEEFITQSINFLSSLQNHVMINKQFIVELIVPEIKEPVKKLYSLIDKSGGNTAFVAFQDSIITLEVLLNFVSTKIIHSKDVPGMLQSIGSVIPSLYFAIDKHLEIK